MTPFSVFSTPLKKDYLLIVIPSIFRRSPSKLFQPGTCYWKYFKPKANSKFEANRLTGLGNYFQSPNLA